MIAFRSIFLVASNMETFTTARFDLAWNTVKEIGFIPVAPMAANEKFVFERTLIDKRHTQFRTNREGGLVYSYP